MSKNKNTNRKENSKPQATSKKDVGIGTATILAAKIAASATVIVALIGLGNTLITIYAERNLASTPISTNEDADPALTTENSETSASIKATEMPLEATPTSTPTSTPTYPLTVIKPTEDDLKIIPIINVGYKDILVPGVSTYTPKISSKRTYLWTYLWCSKHDTTLIENIRDIKFSFSINQILIPEDNFLVFKDYSIDGWPCQRWTTILSGWDISSPPTLSVVYNISHPINDGAQIYDIGEYRHEINLRFTE